MKKRITAIITALLLCTLMTVPSVCAAEEYATPDTESATSIGPYDTIILSERSRMVDMADLLSDAKENSLQSQLDEISERQKVDVVVVTVDSLGYKSPRDYAGDFYDYNDYGFGVDKDGVLLLLSMEERDWYITTTGYGIKAFTDAGIEYIGDEIVPYLSDGEYDDAFEVYAELCDEFITQAKTGRPYDVNNMPKDPFKLIPKFFIAFGIGFAVAFVVTMIMKGQLKSVQRQAAANSYVKQGSMIITDRRDMYLYRTVSKTARPKSDSSSGGGGSSTHSSSSGSSHGGGGGKF